MTNENLEPKEERFEDFMLRFILKLRDMVETGKFEEADKFLVDFPFEEESYEGYTGKQFIQILHCVLSVTWMVRDHLKERKKFHKTAYNFLADKKCKKYAKEILGDLKK